MVVIASVRETRVGPAVARWFVERVKAHGAFELQLVDLKELALPMLDEPRHPRLRQYEHAHTKAWSARVDAADAFVFVTPEYNYGMPPALVNAIDYLLHEWGYKPAGFVSYGGIAGGARSVQMAKQVVTGVRMMPIPEGVFLPFVGKQIDAEGNFAGSEANDKSAAAVLDELPEVGRRPGPAARAGARGLNRVERNAAPPCGCHRGRFGTLSGFRGQRYLMPQPRPLVSGTAGCLPATTASSASFR